MTDAPILTQEPDKPHKAEPELSAEAVVRAKDIVRSARSCYNEPGFGGLCWNNTVKACTDAVCALIRSEVEGATRAQAARIAELEAELASYRSQLVRDALAETGVDTSE